MGDLRHCDSCGVVMGGAPEVCPICATPYRRVSPPQESGPNATPTIDLRDRRPDAPGSTDRMADARTGARSQRSGSATPTRTRPKSPLRPYVPPTPAPTGDGPDTDRPAPLELPTPLELAAPRDPARRDPTTPPVAELATPTPPPPAPLLPLPPAPLPAPLPSASQLPAPLPPGPRQGFPAAPAPGWSAAHQTPLPSPAPATTAPASPWAVTTTRWIRLAVVLLVALAVVAVGLWWQRDSLGGVVSDLRGQDSEESAPASGVGAQLDGVAVGVAEVERGPRSPGP